MVAFITTITAIVYTMQQHDKIVGVYRSKMQEAINQKDFKLASVLGGRLISESTKPDPQLMLSYAMVLIQSGEIQRGTAIINDLAPEDKSGYAAAHLLRARSYAAQLGNNREEKSIEKLRWHLENSGPSNVDQTESLWATYYNAIGQLDEAAKRLENASRINPSSYLALSELYTRMNNPTGVERVLKAAKDSFTDLLKSDPLNRINRLQLAVVLTKQLKIDDAEQLMLQGLELHRDAEMRVALADFYLMRFDIGKSEQTSLSKRFNYLQRAFRLDVNYLPAYNRLIQFYTENAHAEEGKEVIQLLEDMIASGNNTALAHFALSSILLIDGNSDAAQFHLKQAFHLDKQLPVVCNNLAWLLAASDASKLKEALALSEQAVKANPKQANFRDTLGTIYMKLERDQEAITELELALPNLPNKKDVHRKLAILYGRIGQTNLASLHSEKASSLDKEKKK